VLLDLAGHHIDLAQFVLGQRICEVSARVASWRSEQDTAWTEMTLEDGVLMHSFFSLRGTDSNRFEIYGELARLTVDHLAGTLEIVPRGRRKLAQRITAAFGQGCSRLRHGLTGGRDISYELAFSEFVKAIASRRQRIAPDLKDGLRVSQIIDAAERSAATGQKWRMEALNRLAPVG
jgi:predicted dehydrogenase